MGMRDAPIGRLKRDGITFYLLGILTIFTWHAHDYPASPDPHPQEKEEKKRK
jgi:hypothetical protein